MHDLSSALSKREYYNDFTREFAHYYEVYFTNQDKIDRILIDSMQKGYAPDQVLNQVDTIWKDCHLREQNYPSDDDLKAPDYFEFYLRNVLRKILVFDSFEKVFASI